MKSKEELLQKYHDIELLLKNGESGDLEGLVSACYEIVGAHSNESRAWFLASKANQSLNRQTRLGATSTPPFRLNRQTSNISFSSSTSSFRVTRILRSGRESTAYSSR